MAITNLAGYFAAHVAYGYRGARDTVLQDVQVALLVYCTRISPDSCVRRAGRPSGLLHPSLTGFARVGKWHQALLPQCDIMLPPNWWVVSIREGSVHLPRTPFDRGLPPMGPGFVEQVLVAAQGPPTVQSRHQATLRVLTPSSPPIMA